MRRWLLSKKDRKQISERLKEEYGLSISWRANIEKVVEEDMELIVIDGLPAFIVVEDSLIPHLIFLLRRGEQLTVPRIVVDEGAVKPIARGADLMRPGIVRIDGSFQAGQVVVIVEPRRELPIAVHRSLYSSDEIMAMERGRVTKRLHHLGDRYWRLGENVMMPE